MFILPRLYMCWLYTCLLSLTSSCSFSPWSNKYYLYICCSLYMCSHSSRCIGFPVYCRVALAVFPPLPAPVLCQLAILLTPLYCLRLAVWVEPSTKNNLTNVSVTSIFIISQFLLCFIWFIILQWTLFNSSWVARLGLKRHILFKCFNAMLHEMYT